MYVELDVYAESNSHLSKPECGLKRSFCVTCGQGPLKRENGERNGN